MRLDRWLRQALYTAVGVLFITGAAWLVGDRSQVFSRADAWQEVSAYLLMFHGGAAMAFLLLLGALLALHVRVTWRVGKNRPMGIIMLASNALLIGTAFGLYYFGSEGLRRWTSDLHIAVGLGLPILLALHVVLGRRSVSAAKQRPPRRKPRDRGGDHHMAKQTAVLRLTGKMGEL